LAVSTPRAISNEKENAMDAAENVVQHLVQMIEGSADRRVTGVVLGMALRLKYPNFQAQDYGSNSLKQFIQTYASRRIGIVGSAGQDVLYGVVGDGKVDHPPKVAQSDTELTSSVQFPPKPHADAQTSACSLPRVEMQAQEPRPQSVRAFPPDLWMAFSSPTSRTSIFAKPETSEIKLASLDQAETLQAAGWNQVRSLCRQDHIDMARDFVATLPAEVQEKVSHLVGLPGKWWFRFYTSLGEMSPEDAAKWKAFHNLRTQQKLVKAFQKSGISPEKVVVTYGSRRERAGSGMSALRERNASGFDASRLEERPPRAGGMDTLRSISDLLSALGKLVENLSDQQS
jgi:hypothetical protein